MALDRSQTSSAFLERCFWNGAEGRLRAGWRMVAHLAITAILVLSSSLILSLFRDFLMDTPLWASLSIRLVVQLLDVSLAWVCILASLALAGRYLDKRPFRDFGFACGRRWWLDLGFGLALGALLMAGVFGAEYALGWIEIAGSFETNSSTFAAGVWLYAGLFIAVGIQEESLTRGYWLRNIAEGLTSRRIGPGMALLISYLLSSSLFGLLHLGNPNTSWISTVNLMLAGLMLGLPYVLTGDLAIPIGLHVTWNFFQGNVFGFPVSGSAPGTTFIAIRQGGPDLWTGGAFGPEAGLIGVIAMLVGAGLIALWIKGVHGQLTWRSRLAAYAPAVEVED